MPTVFSANNSSVTIGGHAVEGLQSLAFRVVTEREDIRAIGSDERVDVSFGLRTVMGELVVRSSSDELNTHLDNRTTFQLMVKLEKGKGISTTKKSVGYAFDESFLESKSFGLDASGTAVTTYAFSATRVRTV